MATEIKAHLGTQLTADEEKNVDTTKAATLTAQPKSADGVVGQYLAVQVCPYCGCVGYGDESPSVYLIFTCHCCGRRFKA